MKQPPVLTPDSIRETALSALLDVAADGNAPAAARAAASRSLLESIGVIGRNQDLNRINETRAAAEMSPTEISEEISRLARKLPPFKVRKVPT